MVIAKDERLLELSNGDPRRGAHLPRMWLPPKDAGPEAVICGPRSAGVAGCAADFGDSMAARLTIFKRFY